MDSYNRSAVTHTRDRSPNETNLAQGEFPVSIINQELTPQVVPLSSTLEAKKNAVNKGSRRNKANSGTETSAVRQNQTLVKNSHGIVISNYRDRK